MTIFGREPAAWIGLIVSIIAAVLGVLFGQGFITDIQAGRVTDLVEAVSGLLYTLLPFITALLIRQTVTPVAAPKLPEGTVVEVASPVTGNTVEVKTL